MPKNTYKIIAAFAITILFLVLKNYYPHSSEPDDGSVPDLFLRLLDTTEDQTIV